jgi:hypothetical protein
LLKDAVPFLSNGSGSCLIDAQYFGKTGLWEVDEYKLEDMLLNSNYIDACIYKEIWRKLWGGI